MTVYSAAGLAFHIGTVLDASTQSEFAADSYTEVLEVESVGDFGDSAADVPFTSLKDARTRHLKGSKDAGVVSVICGRDNANSGQDAMRSAFDSNFDFNFKVVWPNRITSGGTDGVTYFRGKVMSRSNVNGTGPNNVLRQQFNIGITSALVEVDPT